MASEKQERGDRVTDEKGGRDEKADETWEQGGRKGGVA